MSDKSISYSHGLKWYTYLIASEQHRVALNTNYSMEKISTSFIIARENPYRSFTIFRNHLEFLKFLKIYPGERSFHEVMYRACPVKMYFDIDISKPEDLEVFSKRHAEFVNIFVDTLLGVYLNSYGIQLDLSSDLIWLDGSREGKASFHLIIDNYVLTNVEEAKCLFGKIMEGIPLEFKPWFDMGIYNPNKSFRMLGCVKKGKNYPFALLDNWTYHNIPVNLKFKYTEEEQPKFVTIYQMSLITVYGHCKTLPSIIVRREFKKEDFKVRISQDIIDKVFTLMAKVGECSVSELPYSFLKTEDNRIDLIRLMSSTCITCGSVHDSDNPFIWLKDFQGLLYVYYNCRRNIENKSAKLGTVSIKMEDLIIDDNNGNAEVVEKDLFEGLEDVCKALHLDQNIETHRCIRKTV